VRGRHPAFPVRHIDAQALIGRQVLSKPRLVGTAFEAAGKIACSVGRDLGTEEIERRAEPEVDVAPQGLGDRSRAPHRRDHRCRAPLQNMRRQ
jgi:hypothetical protein